MKIIKHDEETAGGSPENRDSSLHDRIRTALDEFVRMQTDKYPGDECLTMDLHCHDKNSSEPDELLGRMLGIPETWISSEYLLNTLRAHGCDAFTVTNHNNARSCFELIEKGEDILPAAEYSCMVPKFNVGIHVLTYGLSPRDDEKLGKLRADVFRFLDYTTTHNLPVICAHPMYHYKSSGMPPMEFFDLLMVLFERFEVLNGQRDTWQNMLVRSWIESYNPERLETISKLTGIPLTRYLSQPHDKFMSGGSDSHMGIFSGLTGTRLHVPDLSKRLASESRSSLALEAIRAGRMAPFGTHNDSEKMTVALIDYVCQIAENMADPGLLRIVLHKGTARDKVLSLLISNAFGEIRRHKTTMSFLKVFHDSFKGKAPSLREKILVKKEYRPLVDELGKMARVRKTNPSAAAKQFSESLEKIFGQLNDLAAKRARKRFAELSKEGKLDLKSPVDFLNKLELPSRVRSLAGGRHGGGEFGMSSLSLSKVMDDLSFPVLGSMVILAASFTGARVMYNSRPLVREMSRRLNVFVHKPRILWMTDTYEDTNGVAMVLRSIHREIKEKNLPIDIMICSNTVKPDDHLVVLKPVDEITPPFYQNQNIRIPNMMDVHRIFHRGEYDRIICSTEGFMGIAAIYLKQAYSVPAHFFVHTDWMMFCRKVLSLDHHERSRVRRLLRAFYRQFDSLFVLNSDQRSWLTSPVMGFAPEKVNLSAHWVEREFYPRIPDKRKHFGIPEDSQVLLFVGRVSDEKGVMELPEIYRGVKVKIPNVRLVIAGKGPAEERLKELVPDAVFLGWVDHEKLPDLYSSADIFVLPSRFDTFGCVVLEALACGLPSACYASKGPKEILRHGETGYLCDNNDEMIISISSYLSHAAGNGDMREAALARAKEFSPEKILTDLMGNVGMDYRTGEELQA
jgi:glycosyltransferase involved in cell wall biosynthesis